MPMTPLWLLLRNPQVLELQLQSPWTVIPAWLLKGVVCTYEMKLNARKGKFMIVSRSCTMHPQSPLLTPGWTLLKESDGLDILGVIFDSMPFHRIFDGGDIWFEQLLKGLVSWSAGEYLMIDRSRRFTFGVLSCSFWSTGQPCGARLPIHTVSNWTV